MRIAPVAPSGWPSAMAPPSGLTLAGSSSSVVDHGQRLRGEGFVEFDPVEIVLVMPARCSARGIASIGPMPMISGGTPATAKLTKRASGFRL